MLTTRPDRTEAADYYFTYIDRVPDAVDVCQLLEAQLPETVALLRDISDEQSLHRYAPGKWTIREMMSHVNDTERVFTFRAFWFARGLESPLPSFDQDVAVPAAHANDRPWRSLVEEFEAIRGATLGLFQWLPDDAWERRGIASGNPVTVRALTYITAGHVMHHMAVLRERYL